jgi:hypothetical protein
MWFVPLAVEPTNLRRNKLPVLNSALLIMKLSFYA